MASNTMTSNTQRDFVAEAQALGSSATTRKGALRYLADQFYRPTKRRDPYGRQHVESRRGTRVQGTSPWTEPSWQKPGYIGISGWKAARASRRANPEAKRARDDKGFRRRFLARLRREEKRLTADPGKNAGAAYLRLKEIAKLRAIATGRPVAPVPPRAWMTDTEIAINVHKMARRAGLSDNWDGSSYCDRAGDYFSLAVVDSARAPAHHATPDTCIGLVEHQRRRIYSRSSTYKMSDRTDFYVVGQNENGNVFLHQVPATTAGSLAEAMKWIWQGAEIIARQGDIAVAPSPLKHVDGEDADVDVFGGHSRHRFIGEVYRNGSLHVRSGFLYHTAGQHPTIYLDGSCWRRIVIGRRSERRMSTAD